MQLSELTKQIRAAQSAKGVLYQLEVALGHRDGTAADFAFNRRPVQPSGTFRQTRLYEVGANNALIAGSAVDVLERLIRHGTTTSVFYFMGRFAGDYPIYATQRNGDIIMIGSAYYRATEDEPPTYAIRNGTERHAQLLGQLQQDMKHRDKSQPRLVYGKKVDLASAEGEAADLQLLSPVDDEESDVVSVGPSKGRTAFVVTARGDEVETHFTVMEAADLIPSNLADGTVNPDFPQDLQPRDRTRQSSILQISRLSKSLRPAQLADSGLSSHGAPIIGPDRVVESGNGRTLAILRAYAEGNAGGYREHLEQNAQLYGLDSNRISKMREPVLVRVRQTEVDRVKFAKDSNLSDLQGMAPTELARVDAESIDDRLMALFNPSESGDLLAASNRPFVQAFMAKLGTEQAASYMTADGRPTKQIIDRMQAAIFAKAYQNEQLLRLSVEEPDPEIRNVLTALNTAAPTFIEMKYLSGEVHKQTTDDLAGATSLVKGLDEEALSALVDATAVVRDAKASGQDLGEYLSQQGLFGDVSEEAAALAKFIAANNRSAKRMGAAFKALAEAICAELQHQGAAAGDMFGGAAVDLPAILARVSERMAEETGGQVSLFESARESHQLAIEAANTMPHLLAILDSLASADPGRELIPFRKAIEDGIKASTVKEAEQAMELWLTALSIRGMNWKPTNIGELFPPAWQVTKAGSEGFMYALSIKTAVLRAQEHRDSLSGFDELQRRRSAVERDLVTLRTLPATPDDWLTLIMGKPYAEADLWKELEHNAQRRLDGEIDSYLPRIEAITVEAKELSPMDLAESALDDQFIEAMMESTREVKAYLAKAPDQVATARLMATNARRNVRGGMAPAQAFQIAAQGLYDHSSHPYRKEAVRAANAMYRSLAQALKQEEERAVDASSLRQLVDEVIAGSPLSDSDARDMVAKTKIRVTSARLASGYSLPNLRSDLADFYKMTNGKIEPPELSFTNKRASAFHKENRINTGSNLNKVTLWHELGHLLENRHPALLDQSRRLLLRRKNAIKNGPAVLPLRKLIPNLKYGPQEKALNDGFFDYYVGKLYGCQNDNNPMQATSTEVLSMGLQCLASDAGLLVLKKDPEHFALTLAALKYLQEDN